MDDVSLAGISFLSSIQQCNIQQCNEEIRMMVEADGIEPTTYSLQSYRSPN